MSIIAPDDPPPSPGNERLLKFFCLRQRAPRSFWDSLLPRSSQTAKTRAGVFDNGEGDDFVAECAGSRRFAGVSLYGRRRLKVLLLEDEQTSLFGAIDPNGFVS